MPADLAFEQGIEDGEQFVHARDERHLLRFAGILQAVIEGGEDWVVAHGDQGGHVEAGSSTTASSVANQSRCVWMRVLNVVERCNNRLQQWRGLATRYEKRAVNQRAMVVIAFIALWLEP